MKGEEKTVFVIEDRQPIFQRHEHIASSQRLNEKTQFLVFLVSLLEMLPSEYQGIGE